MVGNATGEHRDGDGYPRGVSNEDAAQWAHELTLEVARRTIAVASRKDVRGQGGLRVVFSTGPRKRIENPRE